MKILFFATARVIAGREAEEISVASPASADAVWAALVERHAGLAALRGVARLSRNGAYADAGTVFDAADEVAVIPPVSGG